MTEYRFRPALLRSPRAYRLEQGVLSALDRHGAPEWQLELGRVERAVFVDFGKAHAPVRRLDLFGHDGMRRIVLNTGMGGMEDDRAQFAALAAAIFRSLADTRPDAEVEVGEYGAARLAMLAAGLAALAGGLGLLIAVALTAADRLAEAAVPIAVLILFGGAISWGNRPWRPRPKLAARTMAEVVEGLDRKTV